MASSFTCDGCHFPVENPEQIGHVLKRDYCPVCAPKARAFVEAEEALRTSAQKVFVEERNALIAESSKEGFLLPDVP